MMEKFLYEDLAVMASGRFSVYELARQFNVSEGEIISTMKRFGIENTISRYAHWTPNEDYLLRMMRAQGLPSKEIAYNLNRSLGMIEARVYKLNLPRKKKPTWSSEDIALIIMRRTLGVTFADIATELGKPLPSVVTVYNREMNKAK